MTTYYEGKSLASETEPVGLLTEGAAGIAVIVLAVVSLAGVSAASLTSIAAIVIGVGLMAQGFNSAADNSRMTIAAGAVASSDLAGEVMVDVLAGITGVILGILALIGINVEILLASALIVFGGS